MENDTRLYMMEKSDIGDMRVRRDAVLNLTHKEAADESRFPNYLLYDEIGPYVWIVTKTHS